MTSTIRKETVPSKLTDQELAQARLFLQQTRNAVIGATKRLSDAQWRFRPAAGQWSIAENLDHIVTVQEYVFDPILVNLTASTSSRDYQAVDAVTIHAYHSRRHLESSGRLGCHQLKRLVYRLPPQWRLYLHGRPR